MDLRDQVADAIARTDHPTTATMHPLMEDYRDHANAVMGVVEAHMRELEDENQRMRDDLAHATRFMFGSSMSNFVEVTRVEQPRNGGAWFVRSWEPTERHADVHAALSRAREIAEEA